MAYCPRCQQPLSDPPERFCPNCGADVLAAPPVGVPPPPEVLATAPVATGPGGPDAGPPWERRDRIGFMSALIETVQQVLASPVRFFQTMPVTGGLGGPLLFAVIVGSIGRVAAVIYQAILSGMMGSSFRFGNPELDRFAPYLFGSGVGLVVSAIFAPVWAVITVFVISGIYHLFLLMLSGAQRGFEATFRVVCYGTASALIQIVPFCGGIVAPVYFLVLAILGLSEAHRITRGKSAAAVLLPILILCCCCAVGIGIFAGGLASLLGHAR
jgi:hypothetical protein